MTGFAGFDVSRETMERLELYAELLRKWNPRINLVSKTTIQELWTRHFLDSAQLIEIAPRVSGYWVDLGSGGGFPGLVLSIIGQERGLPRHVTLVESDARKAAFLRTVIREADLPARVINDRIENIPGLGADVVSARALADLSSLIGYADQHLLPGGTAIFPKGVRWEKELADAQSKWNFAHRLDKSITEDGPVILSVTGVSRV